MEQQMKTFTFCCTVDDVSIESMRKVATTFAGVEHRCEFVRELHGVRYFNDLINQVLQEHWQD